MTQQNFTVDYGLTLNDANITATTANNSGAINWEGNSSGDGNGYTTMQLVPDDTLTGTDQYLILDPTAPGHIHIRAGGTQDDSGADLILGGENSYVKITAGSNPPVYVSANNQSWTFTTDGVFQTPGDISASGNVTADNFVGNISITGNVTGTSANVDLVAGSYTWSFNNAGNLVLPGNTFAVNYANGTAVSLGGGSSYGDSNVVTLLSSFGSNTVSTTGNITAGNLRTNNNLTFTANAGNIVFNNTAYISGNANVVGRDGSIMLVPYTGAGSTFPGVIIGGAGRLMAPSGSVHQVFNPSDVSFQVVTKVITGTISTSTTTGALQISGGAGFTGNIYAGGLANITGNINGGNLTTVGQVSATGTITSNGATNSTGFAIGNGAVNNCAIAMTPSVGTAGNYSFRDYSTANSIMFFDTTIGSANIGGSFQFRGSNAYTTYANISQYGVSQPTLPAFRVYGNGVTSVSTTTNTTGQLNGNNWAVDYNQGSYLNSTTGTFTAPVSGLYQVNLVARVANNSGSSSQVIVYKNYGTANTAQVMWETAANCTVNHFGVSTVSKLAAGDTLSLVVTLGQLTFDANDNWSVAFLG